MLEKCKFENGSSTLCIRKDRRNVHLYANIRVSHEHICGAETVERPTDASSRIFSSTREPEDFIGHTREAAKPSAALPQKQRPSILDRLRTRRRKFHVAESGALTVRWIDTGRNQP